MQLIKEHSVAVISVHWATVDWSWPKKWNLYAQADLHFKKKLKVQAGNVSANLPPKSSQARKKLPPPPPVNSLGSIRSTGTCTHLLNAVVIHQAPSSFPHFPRLRILTSCILHVFVLDANDKMWPYPPKQVTLILFMKLWFLHTCKGHSFSFQMIPKLCKFAYRFKSYW